MGVAQVAPALIGGIFWRGATRTGAALGLVAGFAVWAYALFLPSFPGRPLMSDAILAEGPWSLAWLRPRCCGASRPMPRSSSVDRELSPPGELSPAARAAAGGGLRQRLSLRGGPSGWSRGAVESEDLLIMAQRILGPGPAQTLFFAEVARQGRTGYLPDPTPDFLERLERELAGSVGGATAHAMLNSIVSGGGLSVEDLMRVADETAQIMEYSAQLEAKSDELGRTARQLRDANDKLTALSCATARACPTRPAPPTRRSSTTRRSG